MSTFHFCIGYFPSKSLHLWSFNHKKIRIFTFTLFYFTLSSPPHMQCFEMALKDAYTTTTWSHSLSRIQVFHGISIWSTCILILQHSAGWEWFVVAGDAYSWSQYLLCKRMTAYKIYFTKRNVCICLNMELIFKTSRLLKLD